MKFEDTGLDGAWLIVPEPVVDQRGFFMRTMCKREWAAQGLETEFVQHSTSLSLTRATIRGMHYQDEPPETKVVRCLSGAIYDVIVDLRAGSKTFGQHRGFELTSSNRHQLYIPAGFAHGLQALSPNSEVAYLISEFYVPDAARGIRFDDPRLGIAWPLEPTVVSGKDRAWPDFDGNGIVVCKDEPKLDSGGGRSRMEGDLLESNQ